MSNRSDIIDYRAMLHDADVALVAIQRAVPSSGAATSVGRVVAMIRAAQRCLGTALQDRVDGMPDATDLTEHSGADLGVLPC